MAVAQLSEKNMSVVDDILEEAKKAVKDIVVPQQAAVMVSGAIMNAEDIAIRLFKTHDWSGGSFTVKPPEIIEKGTPGVFVNVGNPMIIGERTTKAAVVYVQQINIGFHIRGFLLAWEMSVDLYGNLRAAKVYVEAGDLKKFEKIDWAKIEKKLNESSERSYSFDPTSGAEAGAAITGDGFTGALGSFFGVKSIN